MIRFEVHPADVKSRSKINPGVDTYIYLLPGHLDDALLR